MSGAMKIISADERLAERRGAKILLLGTTGVGKTWQLRTLLLASTALFIDIEAGDQAVLDLRVPTIRIDDWKTARDPIQAFRRRCLIAKRITRPLAARCRISIATKRFLSTR